MIVSFTDCYQCVDGPVEITSIIKFNRGSVRGVSRGVTDGLTGLWVFLTSCFRGGGWFTGGLS